MRGPLEGIRVLDWGMAGVGPEAGRLMAQLGADVIKIEEPRSGDPYRYVEKGGGLNPMMGPQGRSYFFETYNMGKRGITVNLKHAGARDVMARLVAKSDVLVTNYRAKVCTQLGMDYGTLSKHNHRLIYARASGFGTKGPWKDSPSYDVAVAARAGFMLYQRDPNAFPPFTPWGVGDEISSIATVYGIMAAIIARQTTGRGQEVVTSQLASIFWLEHLNMASTLFTGKEFRAIDRRRMGNPLINVYPSGDGKWFAIAMGTLGDRYWPKFCQAIGRPEFIQDPRFSSSAQRECNCEELIRLLDATFAKAPRDTWVEKLQQADCVVSPVNTISEALEDVQVKANEMVVTVDHPVLGQVKVFDKPLELSDTPLVWQGGAPELGQHTEEVLESLAGYSWEEIEKLRSEGVI